MRNCDRDGERDRETETVPSTALPNCCETRLKWAFQYLRRDLANPHSVLSIPPTPLSHSPLPSLFSPALDLACQTFFALSFSKRICACLRCLFEAVLRRQLRQRCSASFFGFGFLSLAFAAILGLFMFCLAASCWGRMRPEVLTVRMRYLSVRILEEDVCVCVCVLGVSIVAA